MQKALYEPSQNDAEINFRKQIFGGIYAQNLPEEMSIPAFLLKHHITVSEWEKLSNHDKALLYCTNIIEGQLELAERFERQLESNKK